MSEGHKYYFGNITWKGNTKYSDSILTVLLGINKGDVYNIETLNKKLGKELSPEGGDISGLTWMMVICFSELILLKPRCIMILSIMKYEWWKVPGKD